jgi:glycosyltransferase involved in cell wall biosynthesis
MASVLSISPYSLGGAVHGGKIRVDRLCRGWTDLGHEVHHLALVTDPAPQPAEVLRSYKYDEVCLERRHRGLRHVVGRHAEASFDLGTDAARRALRGMLTRRFDLGVLHQSHLAPLLDVVRSVTDNVVVDSQNIESQVFTTLARSERGGRTRLRFAAAALKYRAIERSLWNACDARVAVSAEDAEVMVRRTGLPCHVIPNGFDPVPAAATRQPRRHVCFVASFAYPPNISGAVWLMTEVVPALHSIAPGVRVLVVGSSPPAFLGELAASIDGVELVGDPPSVTPYLLQSKVATVPLHAGGGSRLKVVEALAHGCAVVGTPMGLAGLDAELRRHCDEATTAQQFAARIAALLGSTSSDIRPELLEPYRWANLASQYSEAVILPLVAALPEPGA